MDDVQRALERAAEAVCEERNHPDYPCGRGDIDANMARAAVLAFLKAMPDQSRMDAPGVFWKPNLPSTLAAAIEEAQG